MSDEARNGEGLSFSRAWRRPVQAVSRIWSAPDDESGEPHVDPGRSAIVDCALYRDGVRQPGTIDYREGLAAARKDRNAFVWLGLHEPYATQMRDIAEAFGLHELAVSDVVNAGQRAKLEQFGDVHFLVLRSARYMEHEELSGDTDVVETGQVMLLIGDHFVISVRHGEAATLAPVRKHLEARKDLLKHGPWAVAYAVTDHVVDIYVDVAQSMESDLDTLEEAVFSNGSSHGRIQQIYQLKRELVEFKRAVVPLIRPMMTLTGEQSEIPRELRRYFRDAQDHLTRTVEQVVGFDELLNSILQARLAQVTVDQNNDMRKIAAWAGIAAVWTAIAGIYGMNFDFMPELHWRIGYPLAVSLMVGASFLLYRQFRRSGWL
ncbi:magnesium transporter [Allocatelliglobosispora scoriae]|uniref:Magnesium transporter n=1 Tax=Allocatelliglobosispora scoriae TaxID=643052 RepID=A0A841BTW2_9ACTN|nr:magnesium and cobalt transport protein CorA [Allocatelliglobosispora scoriae]MBB5871135.1 magnesium transporter [Allocatelliglobosispora scoriae]